MPFTITKSGECPDNRPHAVMKVGEDGKPMGKSLGCHESRQAASKQIAAIESEEKRKGMSITLDRVEEGWSVAMNGDEVGVYSESTEALDAITELWEAQETPTENRPAFRLEFREGEETADFRIIDVGAITFEREQTPFMFTRHNDGHGGAAFAGMVEQWVREGDDFVVGYGRLDDVTKNPDAAEAYRLLESGQMMTWSPGLGRGAGDSECLEMDANGMCMKELLHIRSGILVEATMLPVQALNSAKIMLVEAEEPAGLLVASGTDTTGVSWTSTKVTFDDTIPKPWISPKPKRKPKKVSLVAAAVKDWSPPREMFEVPESDQLHPLVITADGQVFGFLAAWNQCHTAFSDRCIFAPRSRINYGAFHVGSVLCADGEPLPVGTLTVGPGHAELRLGERETRAHYDNACTPWAVVRATDGERGIWVSGSVLPDVDQNTLMRARACALSGDWRQIGGSLELVAALSVPRPGFPLVASGGPVPTEFVVRSAFEDDACTALVAAGAFTVEQHRVDPRMEAFEAELEELRAFRAEAAPLLALLAPQAVELLKSQIHEGNGQHA